MLHHAITVRGSRIEGVGLIADRHIPAGEVLYELGDAQPTHQYDLVYLPPQARFEFMKYAIQIGDDEFVFQQGDVNNINHSCDPAAWWEPSGILKASRDIRPGDEIAYDYSTTDIQLHYRFDCQCGSESCRGIVTDKDCLKPEFQRRYEGHLQAHVLAAIRRAEAGEADPYHHDISRTPPEILDAVKKALVHASEFQARFGRGYGFEMVRYTVLCLQSPDGRPVQVPQRDRRYDDRYLFTLVRQLMLQPLT